jgi:tellurite resistance protein
MSKNADDHSGRRITTSEGSVRKDQEAERRETMTIAFENPAEASSAIASVVMAADNVCTMEERDFLVEHMKRQEVFQGYDDAQLIRLQADAVERVYDVFPIDGSPISRQGVDRLLDAAKEVLSREQRADALRMALCLARSDELCEEERSLLEHLQRGLQVDDQVAQDILGS